MTLRALAALALSLLGLNFLLTLANLWPTPWVRPAAALSLDLAGLVLLLALAVELRARRFMTVAVALALLVLLLGHYAQITLAGLFGRPLDLYWDLRHLPSLARMITRVTPAWGLALLAVGLPLALAGLYLLCWWLAQPLLDALDRPTPRRALALVAGLVLLLGLFLGEPWRAPSVVAGAWSQARKAVGHLVDPGVGPGGAALAASDLKALKGGDLYIIFWESYGDSGPIILPEGWQIASARVEAPTFGGGSWLSHASLLTGRMLGDQGAYEALVAEPGPSLIDRARAAGYRSVALMPGLKSPWPEGAAFGFDRIYDAAALDYDGPAFGWWAIPDQVSLARLYDLEIARPARAPLLVVFASVMSHIPFAPTPPYEPDWSRVTGARPFDPAALAAALAQRPSWGDLRPAYQRALAYNRAWLAGFLGEQVPVDATVLVLGDHQPPALVSGPEASWAVPLHLFSRDRDLLARLTARGFSPGQVAPAETTGDMAWLTGQLLEAFDGRGSSLAAGD